ncbi:hypothetical protein [Demequina globuliformis]|uniref:hypothetical protein n=1 Tax=Demequina globuliformis TaxID=676202 RepID=UPI0007839880|nr:hypothetical protein [Demequina globuliformis]
MTTLVATGAARRVALLAALVALVATVAFWVTPASAAHLTVTHARIATFTASACTTQTIGFTAPSASSAQTSVTVTGIPASCAGKTGRAVLVNSQGAKVADLTWTMASGSQTVSVPGFPTANVTGAKLVANGWWVPASWTAPEPPPNPPAGQCWGMLHSNGQRVQGTTCVPTFTAQRLQNLAVANGGPGTYRDVSIRTDFTPAGYVVNGTYVGEYQALTKWRATVDLTSAAISSGINLTGPVYIYSGQNTVLAPGETCSNLAAVTFQESVQGNNPTGDFTISSAPIPWMSASRLLCSR